MTRVRRASKEEEAGNVGSPGFVRLSLAAAMTLGFRRGLFYRGARLGCVNLLLTYPGGCSARCAYCGLSRSRTGPGEARSFIRVPWPAYRLDEVMERIEDRAGRVKRICVSMITRRQAVRDTKEVCRRLRSRLDVPVSLLVCPTLLSPRDLEDFKEAGADKIGVAIDLATAALFDRYRGAGAGGPHRWERYWQCLSECLAVFGEGNAGAHFIVGMGETEQEMCRSIQRVRDMGGRTHLFSFYPEPGSGMADRPPPPLDRYRRIQVARHLIDNGIRREGDLAYDRAGRITDFGMSPAELEGVIDTGEPFRTSGCTGGDGEVACNRPYANEPPGPEIRNYPFRPTREDLKLIRSQIRVRVGAAG